MLGMIEGNGHPYSWSAIINGYAPAEMAKCPYPAIPKYLGAEPLAAVKVPGVRVTHIWTDDPEDAPKVAAAARIEHVVRAPEEVIGQVDAVVLATDDGNDHVRRARPFVAAGLPVFVDKPLAINVPDLRQFVTWERGGARILSNSGMRYAPEIRELVERRRAEYGELRWITSFTCKTWERYGIHALEAVQPLVGPGFESVQTITREGSDLVQILHRSGVQLTLAAIHDAYGSFGGVHVYGTAGQVAITLRDTYRAFRGQLVAFAEFLRTGERSYPFEETIELMAVIIAGIRSRDQSGRVVPVTEILAEIENDVQC